MSRYQEVTRIGIRITKYSAAQILELCSAVFYLYFLLMENPLPRTSLTLLTTIKLSGSMLRINFST